MHNSKTMPLPGSVEQSVRVQPCSLRSRTRGRNRRGTESCRACRGPGNKAVGCGWCDDCLAAYNLWAQAWEGLGMLPRVPDELREERIALYQIRAEQELDLFEPPLCLPIRD